MLTIAGQFAYANSKAAFKQQAFHIATHLKGTGIRVNQIAPGVFPSESTSKTMSHWFTTANGYSDYIRIR